MENTSYYLGSERLVFLTEEDARDYFIKEEVCHCESECFSLNDFLDEKGYNCEQVFFLDEREKEDILADYLANYHEALFENWVSEELITCDIYMNNVK